MVLVILLVQISLCLFCVEMTLVLYLVANHVLNCAPSWIGDSSTGLISVESFFYTCQY